MSGVGVTCHSAVYAGRRGHPAERLIYIPPPPAEYANELLETGRGVVEGGVVCIGVRSYP